MAKQLTIATRAYAIHVVLNVADLVRSGKIAPAVLVGDGLAVAGVSNPSQLNQVGNEGREFHVDHRGGYVDLTPEFSALGEPVAAWWCPTSALANVSALETVKPIAREGHVLLQLAARPSQKGTLGISFFVALERDVEGTPGAAAAPTASSWR